MSFFSNKSAPHEDEGTWIVSYADMMTLLCCFFIILYSFSQLDDKKFSEFSTQITETMNKNKARGSQTKLGDVTHEERQLRALHLLVGMMNTGESVDGIVKRLEEKAGGAADLKAAKEVIQENMKKGGVDLVVDTEKLSIVIPETGLFDTSGLKLIPSGEKRLVNIAEKIAKIEGLVDIEVVGHRQQPLAGSKTKAQSSWALSAAGAGVVADYLIEKGINKRSIAIKGMGNLDPIFPEKGSHGEVLSENQAKNRRIEIILRKKKK